ncbi:MAG TPA: DUF4038 domain-containing protein [Planctomycetota bacterium]|nr:DUF4038 domain-containing protein [Planctomycetota bacterium]
MTQATQWCSAQLNLEAAAEYSQPYIGVDVWMEFTHASGRKMLRPAFWDGGRTWRVRFAAPLPGQWTWTSHASVSDAGLAGKSGTLEAAPSANATRFERHGLLKMSPKGLNVVHDDGTPFMLAADTAWCLLWRATLEQCREYARDRQRKGFNAALLMSVQPDMKGAGPRKRNVVDGFMVGFEDLPSGHINQMNVEYFQELDAFVDILVAHEIVPVWQPVFHGYGWRGGIVAGKVIPAEEYARYCRYLVARYGASPAIWLVAADGDGFAPGVEPGGREIEKWDAYQQPTGIHFQPHTTNRAWQDRAWLDFQWCQTGHMGEHLPERVADMVRNFPRKAVANGEPTYEHIGEPGRSAGLWQLHEAWSNLCAGGTMGVVYGAGSLWQWRIDKTEQHAEWCMAREADWREALAFEGSNYAGLISKIFEGLDFADMEPNWEFMPGGRGLLKPGKLAVRYLEAGGAFGITSDLIPRKYRIVDPRNGEIVSRGELGPQSGWMSVDTKTKEPRVVIFCENA